MNYFPRGRKKIFLMKINNPDLFQYVLWPGVRCGFRSVTSVSPEAGTGLNTSLFLAGGPLGVLHSALPFNREQGWGGGGEGAPGDTPGGRGLAAKETETILTNSHSF